MKCGRPGGRGNLAMRTRADDEGRGSNTSKILRMCFMNGPNAVTPNFHLSTANYVNDTVINFTHKYFFISK